MSLSFGNWISLLKTVPGSLFLCARLPFHPDGLGGVLVSL
jgi:hypothetical protein